MTTKNTTPRAIVTFLTLTFIFAMATPAQAQIDRGLRTYIIDFNPQHPCTKEGFSLMMGEVPPGALQDQFDEPGSWHLVGGYSTEPRSWSSCPPDKQRDFVISGRVPTARKALEEAGWRIGDIRFSGVEPRGAVVRLEWRPSAPRPEKPLNSLIRWEREDDGRYYHTGLATNRNDYLDDDEIQDSEFVPDPADPLDGARGDPGDDGKPGFHSLAAGAQGGVSWLGGDDHFLVEAIIVLRFKIAQGVLVQFHGTVGDGSDGSMIEWPEYSVGAGITGVFKPNASLHKPIIRMHGGIQQRFQEVRRQYWADQDGEFEQDIGVRYSAAGFGPRVEGHLVFPNRWFALAVWTELLFWPIEEPVLGFGLQATFEVPLDLILKGTHP